MQKSVGLLPSPAHYTPSNPKTRGLCTENFGQIYMATSWMMDWREQDERPVRDKENQTPSNRVRDRMRGCLWASSVWSWKLIRCGRYGGRRFSSSCHCPLTNCTPTFTHSPSLLPHWYYWFCFEICYPLFLRYDSHLRFVSFSINAVWMAVTCALSH